MSVTHRLSPEWAIVGGALGAGKFNRNANEFDTLTLDGNLGARYSINKEAFTVGLQLQQFDLDYARFRETTGAIAQWQHLFDEFHQATLFAQYSELRYPTQDIRDANRTIIGAAYSQAFSGQYSPVVFGSLYTGREDEISANVPHLGHVPVGVRLGGEVRISAGLSAFANTSYEYRRYGGPDPFFCRSPGPAIRRERRPELRDTARHDPDRPGGVYRQSFQRRAEPVPPNVNNCIDALQFLMGTAPRDGVPPGGLRQCQ